MDKETQIQHNTLVELVTEEASNLKKYATKLELMRLRFSFLDPNSATDCIYGQMTGDCFSDRADELIERFCSKVYEAIWDNSMDSDISKSPLNGKPTGNRTHSPHNTKYWSPIEVFITNVENQTNGNNEKLVKYLRGEVEELNFI